MPFVTFETGAWDDPWVQDLPAEQKLFWVYLCTSPEAFEGYGVIEPRFKLWELRTGLQRGSIEESINMFVAAGKIIRHGDYLWIVKYIHHRRLKGRNLEGAIAAIRIKLDKTPELLEQILDYLERGYNGVITGMLNQNQNQNQNQNRSVEEQPAAAGEPDGSPPAPADRKSRIKASEVPIPSLIELESRVPEPCRYEWLQFKAACCESNKSGTMAETKLARYLDEILRKAERDGLSVEALAYGLQAAANKGAANVNYVIKAAAGYTPPRNGKPPAYDPDAHPRRQLERA